MKIFFDFSLDFFADIKKRYTFAPVKRNTQRESVVKCGNSSVGRAQPCQGWGREFEPRFPLKAKAQVAEW